MVDARVVGMIFIAVLGQLGAVVAQVPTVDSSAEQRLKYMQSSGASYEVEVGDGGKATFRPQPVLRWSNPVSGVVDGALVVWEDESKRPVAVAQVFIAPGTDDLWLHEFQSLSQERLSFTLHGQPVWTPTEPGVEMKALNDAPPPAGSALARLAQMRQLCRRFSAQDKFQGGDAKDPLRMMSAPLLRYSDALAEDGAVFAFAHGTDPELLVVIELRKSGEGESRWHVGLAPMTSYAITAELDNREYWSVPWRQAPHPRTATFLDYAYPPQGGR